jgi:hypothetical protein
VSEDHEEFETKEDLMDHIEKEHPDLAYVLACLTKPASQAKKMIV